MPNDNTAEIDTLRRAIIEGTETQRLKNQIVLQLLQAWRTDDAQEQADTWMVIKVALEEDRLSDRLLFR